MKEFYKEIFFEAILNYIEISESNGEYKGKRIEKVIITDCINWFVMDGDDMYRQFAAADDDNFRIPVGLEPKNQDKCFFPKEYKK